MISIPIAVNNSNFAWQAGLFWQQHKKLYGEENAKKLALCPLINRNYKTDTPYGWPVRMPTIYVDGVCETNMMKDVYSLPLNIQLGVLEALNYLPDHETIEVLDCDMFHIKAEQKVAADDVLYADPIYENWHLHSKTIHWDVITPFVKTQDYYNGGFVPIICTVRTMKKIIHTWIEAHRFMLETQTDTNLKWWSGMESLQVACEINKIKMIDTHDCYIPPINSIEGKRIAHYSVDTKWARKKTKNPVGSTQDLYTTAILEYIEAQKKPPIS